MFTIECLIIYTSSREIFTSAIVSISLPTTSFIRIAFDGTKKVFIENFSGSE